MIGVARDAFVQGMQVASTISAVLAVGVAILAVVMLRNVGSGEDREAAAEADGGADAGAGAGADHRDHGTKRPESIGATAVPLLDA